MTAKSIKDTGERLIPEKNNLSLSYAEHMQRYLAARELVKGKIVLDIACGTGYGSQMMAKRAKKVYGVDVDPATINYAQQTYPAGNLEYLIGEAQQIPLQDKSVDIVVSFETVEHIKDYEEFIKEIKRVLKDDGLCVISTPNDLAFAEGNEFHLHEFSYEELLALLKGQFKNIKPYFQSTWKFVGLTNERELTSKDATISSSWRNSAPLNRDQAIYFLMLCSNRRITENLNSDGVVGEFYSERLIVQLVNEVTGKVTDELTNKHNVKLMEYRNHADRAQKQLNAIASSRRFRLASKAAKVANYGRLPLMEAAKVRNRISIRQANSHYERIEKGAYKRTSDNAVYIHLYDSELWKYFTDLLKSAASQDFDLFITLTPKQQKIAEQIRHDFPDANILETPNRGRDVLPFLKTAKLAQRLGYKSILKLHSKKSKHTAFGKRWLDDMATKLLPADTKALNQILETLARESTGIIGPTGWYITLPVNFEANRDKVLKILSRAFSLHKARQVDKRRRNYGYFAGMMFWCRMDVLEPLINTVDVADFEREKGQIDATMAHAFERVICLVAELQGRKLYEVGPDGIRAISYKTDNIPQWEKPKK